MHPQDPAPIPERLYAALLACDHKALTIQIRGCHGEVYEFMIDTSFFGGISNDDHIFGPGDVSDNYMPMPDKENPPNDMWDDAWDWFKKHPIGPGSISK